jgi:hypothetical protein
LWEDRMAVCGAEPTPERPTDDECKRLYVAVKTRSPSPAPAINCAASRMTVKRRAAAAREIGGERRLRPRDATVPIIMTLRYRLSRRVSSSFSHCGS